MLHATWKEGVQEVEVRTEQTVMEVQAKEAVMKCQEMQYYHANMETRCFSEIQIQAHQAVTVTPANSPTGRTLIHPSIQMKH